MYLPRALVAHLYTHLTRTHHPLSPPVLILVALEPDALCACKILTALLKRDYIPHKIKPIAGYSDLTDAGQSMVQPMRMSGGGSGGVVVCLGVGGLVDLESVLGLENDNSVQSPEDGVDVWVFDARRPWNLANVFGGLPATDDPTINQGQITRPFKPGKGGILVFDDGDVEEELGPQRDAWTALAGMPDIEDDGESVASDSDDEVDSTATTPISRKRKSWSDQEDNEENESDKENVRPPQRRRSNSSSPIPSSPPISNRPRSILRDNSLLASTPPSNQYSFSSPPPQPPKDPSPRTLRRRLLRMRRKHETILRSYHSSGTSYSEPISSLMYSLASELGREDNDLLWLAIIGVTSCDLYGRTSTGISLTDHDAVASSVGWTGSRGSRIRQLLRDETRRLNPPELNDIGYEVPRGGAGDAIPIHGRSPTDTSIRLSPEPRFLLIRHWSLYESMLHSPYLGAKLHIWSDAGRRRLHKLLAKMGVSLSQCRQSYTHMDMELKQQMRTQLLKFGPMYGLDALVPPASTRDKEGWGFVRSWGWKACLSSADVAIILGATLEIGQTIASVTGVDPTTTQADDALTRFYAAYDALSSPARLLAGVPLAQSLHRAILRTGTTLLQKRQIRHLRAFRMALVKEGPDVSLFRAPGALTKLALWVGEAVAETQGDKGKAMPLVLGCLDEARGVYVVVGIGGGRAVGDAEETKRRKEKREAQAKRKAERQKVRIEKLEARRRAREVAGLDDEDDETEEEASSSEDESDVDDNNESKDDGGRRNRFGPAFQEVVEETAARVRLDSFEHCVVEVRKEDLSGFLESLSMKVVLG